MIVELSFPATVRAKPPRCISVKQVICNIEMAADVAVMNSTDLHIAARFCHSDGKIEDIRHDGTTFFRRVCGVNEGTSVFPAWMKYSKYLKKIYRKLLGDDHQNGLEYSEHTWPVKPRSRGRPHVSFADVVGFDLLNGDDVACCEGEVARLMEALRVYDGSIWVRCGEPCYRLWRGNNRSNEIQMTFSDQDEANRVDEQYISALTPDLLEHERLRLTGQRDRQFTSPGAIEVIIPDYFITDFYDRGFMKFARFVAHGMAYHLTLRNMSEPCEALMGSAPEDIDLWNELRRTITRMEEAGTANAGNDELVVRAAERWMQLGGGVSTPRYSSWELNEEWFGTVVNTWLDRSIDFNRIVRPALSAR